MEDVAKFLGNRLNIHKNSHATEKDFDPTVFPWQNLMDPTLSNLRSFRVNFPFPVGLKTTRGKKLPMSCIRKQDEHNTRWDNLRQQIEIKRKLKTD